ncbi:MAG: hypothetical protein K9J13_12410 [Saprospiraceae bacterium]|nr:hypothetical protein [Saprospiraceae bacterium]
MKITLSLIFLIIINLLPSSSQAQLDSSNTRGYLYINPTQLLFREVIISYERKLSDKNTIGLSLGFRPSRKSKAEIDGIVHGMGGDYELQNMGIPFYNAVYISVSPKFFIYKKHPDTYLSCELFNRYWWFNNKYVEFNNVEGYRFKATRTERVEVIGVKLLYGQTNNKVTLKNKTIYYNIYQGIGYRAKLHTYESWNGTINNIPIVHHKTSGALHLITFHFGIQIGLGIHK